MPRLPPVGGENRMTAAEIRLAFAELVALAVAMRPDWNPQIVAGAIRAGQQAKWPDGRILCELARLIADPRADPRDLSRAARPLERERRDGTVAHYWAEQARLALPERAREAGDGK
jgi:hypothetical protein